MGIKILERKSPSFQKFSGTKQGELRQEATSSRGRSSMQNVRRPPGEMHEFRRTSKQLSSDIRAAETSQKAESDGIDLAKRKELIGRIAREPRPIRKKSLAKRIGWFIPDFFKRQKIKVIDADKEINKRIARYLLLHPSEEELVRYATGVRDVPSKK